jgi:hypothetical protein
MQVIVKDNIAFATHFDYQNVDPIIYGDDAVTYTIPDGSMVFGDGGVPLDESTIKALVII